MFFYGVYSINYHQNGWYGHNIIALGYLGEKRNTWRENVPWIYSNHNNPYILTVNFGLTNQWVFCNVDLECGGCFGAPPQGGRNNVHRSG